MRLIGDGWPANATGPDANRDSTRSRSAQLGGWRGKRGLILQTILSAVEMKWNQWDAVAAIHIFISSNILVEVE